MRRRTGGLWLCALCACAVASEEEILAPPREGEGFQVALGPFELGPGEERRLCALFAGPAEGDVAVHRFTVLQSGGALAARVWRAPGAGAAGQVRDCWEAGAEAGWTLVHEVREGAAPVPSEWTLPAGVAHRFRAGELFALEAHQVNTGPGPLRGKVTVNFLTQEWSKVWTEVGTLVASAPDARICPGQARQVSRTCLFARAPVTVTAAVGRMSARGVRFEMSALDAATEADAPFYASLAWDRAPFLKDLAVHVTAGGGVRFTCTLEAAGDACGDPERACCFEPGPSALTEEECGAALFFYPAFTGGAAECF